MNPERTIAYRKQASILVEAVLDEEISARAALNSWPREGNEDASVGCAYTMLWYFEADEDRHHLEVYYLDAQIQLFREVINYLKQGQSLPDALIQEYKDKFAPSELHYAKIWQDPIKWLQQQMNLMLAIIETHPAINERLASVDKTKQKRP